MGGRCLGKWEDSGVELEVKQYAISAIGILPLQNNVNVFGRVGFNRVSGEISALGRSEKDKQNSGVVGLGIGYSFTPAISGRVEFQKPTSDSHNLSAAVAFQF